jgi:hypothetical protein
MTVGFVHDETFVGVVRFGGVPLRGHWYDLRDLSLSPSVWQCSSGDDVMVEEEYSFVARSLHHAKKQVLQRQRERERERTTAEQSEEERKRARRDLVLMIFL